MKRLRGQGGFFEAQMKLLCIGAMLFLGVTIFFIHLSDKVVEQSNIDRENAVSKELNEDTKNFIMRNPNEDENKYTVTTKDKEYLVEFDENNNVIKLIDKSKE